MSSERPNPKRKHHELPELYLRGFSRDSFLWIYERLKPYAPGKKKGVSNPCRWGVVEIAERDRYARALPDGTMDFDSYENRLERIEKAADGALRKVRSQVPISSNEKETLASYVQNLLKRTTERERRSNELLAKIQKSPEWSRIALSLALNGQFETARGFYEAQRYLQSENGRKTLLLESAVTLYPGLHKILTSMVWTFYVAVQHGYFVTSSAPVFIDPVGLARSPLLFPVSKGIALIAAHKDGPDLRFRRASVEETLMINFCTIVNAPSVYAPKPEVWIWEILEHGLAMTARESAALQRLFPFRDIS